MSSVTREPQRSAGAARVAFQPGLDSNEHPEDLRAAPRAHHSPSLSVRVMAMAAQPVTSTLVVVQVMQERQPRQK